MGSEPNFAVDPRAPEEGLVLNSDLTPFMGARAGRFVDGLP